MVVTNDRDSPELAVSEDHAGFVVYTDRSMLITDPAGSAEAISAMDRYYSPSEIHAVVERLDNWR